MRSRALASARSVLPSGDLPRASPAALGFLRGRDADGRLRELGAARTVARPVLGALAAAFREDRAHEKLGYRSLGDYAGPRLGVGARTLREWARVWSTLESLPRLRGAVLSGEVSWTVARLVVGIVTPETEEACLETVRGRTVRAVKALIEAFREAGPPTRRPALRPEGEEDDEERVQVRIPCDRRAALLWTAAVELARRVAGEALPVWQCAERVAAEAASVLGAPNVEAEGFPRAAGRSSTHARPADESGLRAEAFASLSWKARTGSVPPEMAELVEGLEECDARELDRRLRAATAFLQSLDFETGRILRQVQQRRLFAELGVESFARYCEERLDLAPRTARSLVALARAEHRAPAVATEFRQGRIHAFQAHALLRVADLDSAQRWVKRAKQVTLRRLEDDVDAEAPIPRAIVFQAPPAVAELFLAMLARAGSIERLLAHAIATWVELGQCFDDYADFERDGFRCTVPGCTARRNLQSHHIWFRSHQGPDVPWNRTTLCATHHQRSVHLERTVVIQGRAPDVLIFELGGERWLSGDVRDSKPVPPGTACTCDADSR